MVEPQGSPHEAPQQAQYRALTAEVTGLLEKHGLAFSELKVSVQKDIKDAAGQIAKLSDYVAETRKDFSERFRAFLERDQGSQFGGAYRGVFAHREQAAEFGRLVGAIVRRDREELGRLQKAAITPGTGPEGGYLLAETLLPGIIRNVEEYGAFEANCPAFPVRTFSGGAVIRTGGFTVYYPAYGQTFTASAPTVGATHFQLKRACAGGLIDNWMLASELAAALGEFVANELALALALANDTDWFVGDGTSTYHGFTGVMKASTVPSVGGDSGDDTFAEMIAKSTYYLAAVLGKAPAFVHRIGPRWYMHLAIFFGYLGVRDTAGLPIANILTAQAAPAFYLMGYPVVPTQVAPSTTAISTCFVLFGALARACSVYRHTAAIELAYNEALKFWEGQTAVKCDVPQDMLLADPNCLVQLKTAAAQGQMGELRSEISDLRSQI